ncbi:hypothetical protein [Nitrospirillum amazonense]|uniref:hypothetical protein n=1 Tax=Nitrospirillum amazonense TaxID=28077 RepID=UPI0011A48F9E|nr:hypothetical protein [Nitrospirillum amazonense]
MLTMERTGRERPALREVFIVVTDMSGRRHALAPSFIAGISDADDTAMNACVTLRTGAVLLITESLDALMSRLGACQR